MKTYKYLGTMMTCLPLKTGDVVLHPGKCAELPEEVDVVRTLAAKRLLEEVPETGENIPLNPPSKGDLTEAGGTPALPVAEKTGRKSKSGA